MTETRPVRILTVDGGGIRGIIPAVVLVEPRCDAVTVTEPLAVRVRPAAVDSPSVAVVVLLTSDNATAAVVAMPPSAPAVAVVLLVFSEVAVTAKLPTAVKPAGSSTRSGPTR